MSFEMSIERPDGEPIPLEAWLAVARPLEELRERTEPQVARNPRTGKTISVPSEPGTFMLRDEPLDRRVDAILWSEGRLILEGGLFAVDGSRRSLAERIAAALGAVIVDAEDGEFDEFEDVDPA